MTVSAHLPHYPLVSERVNHPHIPSITQKRLNNFSKSDHVSQNVSALLNSAHNDDDEHVHMMHWAAPGSDRPFFDEATTEIEMGSNLRQIRKGDVFGPPWSNHWVKVELTIPEAWSKAGRPVIFEFDPSCEALIYSEEGKPIHGLTGSSISPGPAPIDVRRTEHIIPPHAVNNGRYTMYIEVSCSSPYEVGMFDIGFSAADMNRSFPLLHAHLAVPNVAVRDMHADFRMLHQISQSTENRASDLPRRAMKAANAMMDAFRRVPGDKKDPDLLTPVVEHCRSIAWKVLGSLSEEDRKALAPWDPNVQPNAKVWAIGHCHIDTAWLWRFTQAQQKVARSWTTQCDLMDRWPNHHFAASSAVQYSWLEQLYPAAFEQVKHYVAKGRFHPVGGAWLEPDCNLPAGESLVRQHLYGQRYFQSTFGIRCREAWLPDTFGYTSQLPQILRQCGIQYFTTQKLRYNITPFPYTTFNWVALDGSQVLAHITPADTYKGQCDFKELEKCLWNNKNVADAPASMLIFGNGGAGGGPTPGMLEKLERLSSLSLTNGEAPSVRIAKPADFFDHLLLTSEGGKSLPSWRGELYLEFHRGTYTTQANVKKGNQTMERLLRSLEYFATLASIRNRDYTYPRAELEDIWHDTMLNQFHDVLPGTTISLVVNDVMDIFKRRSAQAEQLIEDALIALYPGSRAVQSMQDVSGPRVVAVDPLRLTRSEVVELSDGAVLVKTDQKGTGPVHPVTEVGAPRAYAQGDIYFLENGDFRLTIADGRIKSLVDRHLDRELIIPGPGAETGGLTLYEDYPLEWDAWDTEIYHLQSYQHIQFQEVEAIQTGHRAELKATAKFEDSTAILTFSLVAASIDASPSDRSFVRIDAHIDWQAEHQMLKFVLPVDIHSPHASYGTQFGLIERPTHRNTPHDQAKFEVCGHNFSDLSETGYGVAIASAKYGYSIEGNVMRVSLLRGSTSPDPKADRHIHDIPLAIMPHVGFLQSGGTYRQAMAFNNPVYLRTEVPTQPEPLPSFVVEGTQGRSIVLETIKLAEDSDAVILRMYEALGSRAAGHIKISGVKVQDARWVNLLEEPVDEAKIKTEGFEAEVSLSFRAFEIKTLMVDLSTESSNGWQYV